MHTAALVLIALVAAPPQTTRLAGVVRDVTGLPLAGVAVEVNGALVDVTDAEGRFSITAAVPATLSLRVALPGFETRQLQVRATGAQSSQPIVVVLTVGRMTDEVTVTATRPAASAERPIELAPIDAYRTPGTEGDLFRALQTMPGTADLGDSAGLFVRGGDVSEVLVSIDGATMAHPYRYETPAGGFRGAVDPFNISGLAFSAGGFGARYGNVLSAVVDMRGLDRPRAAEVSGTAGLAGVSASGGAPLGRLGARAAVNRTLTSVLFAVNGTPRHFDPPPEGWDASAGLTWNGGRIGSGRAFFLSQRDNVGVDIEAGAFEGRLSSASRHDFAAARWDVPMAGWITSASWGSDLYERRTTSGVLDLAIADSTHSWRVDGQRTARGVTWIAGANGALKHSDVRGRVPTRGGDLGGVSGDVRFSARGDDWFAGTFLEASVPIERVTVALGGRVDRFSRAQEWSVDPRMNVRVQLTRTQSVRLATGLYSQAPDAIYYDEDRGATRLSPMRATHYVAGYELGSDTDPLFLRVEAYRKTYRKLPLESAGGGFSSDGYGSANGLDAYAGWTKAGIELKAIGSWLQARRRWTPAGDQGRYPIPDGPWAPDFEVPLSMRLIALVPLPRNLSAGASWRTAAGRPFTPVAGAVETGRGYVPIYGTINSQRVPRYERLDLSVSWLRATAGGMAVVFASLDNALGRANFFEYAYSPDYSVRRPVASASPRSFYAGVTFRR